VDVDVDVRWHRVSTRLNEAQTRSHRRDLGDGDRCSQWLVERQQHAKPPTSDLYSREQTANSAEKYLPTSQTGRNKQSEATLGRDEMTANQISPGFSRSRQQSCLSVSRSPR
jgi:hypothetical protein